MEMVVPEIHASSFGVPLRQQRRVTCHILVSNSIVIGGFTADSRFTAMFNVF